MSHFHFETEFGQEEKTTLVLTVDSNIKSEMLSNELVYLNKAMCLTDGTQPNIEDLASEFMDKDGNQKLFGRQKSQTYMHAEENSDNKRICSEHMQWQNYCGL